MHRFRQWWLFSDQKETDIDYENLIEQLKRAAPLHGTWLRDRMLEAATATETSLEERDAAQKQAQDLQIQWDMYGGDEGVTATFQKAEERDDAVKALKKFGCNSCKREGENKVKCNNCFATGGWRDSWEWRGPQKESESDGQA